MMRYTLAWDKSKGFLRTIYEGMFRVEGKAVEYKTQHNVRPNAGYKTRCLYKISGIHSRFVRCGWSSDFMNERQSRKYIIGLAKKRIKQ
jgi:hypothetical protein